MRMRSKVLMCLSVAALLGTVAIPPLPEAEGQVHSKKKKKKKAGGAKGENCSFGFEPGGGRKPKQVCR
jgi:hypothetical protein